MTQVEKVRKVVEECRKAGLTADEILEGLMEVTTAKDAAPKQHKLTRENYVIKMFDELGTPKNILGYSYLREAVLYYRQGMQIVNEVYAQVANKFKTTAGRVDRAMRHAIEVTISRCPYNMLEAYFGNTIHPNKDKPTNSEFIATLAERLEIAMRPE